MIEEDKFTRPELANLLRELELFKQTELFRHYKDHFQALFDSTVKQTLNEKLTGVHVLFQREAWIGEARSAELNRDWFDEFEQQLKEEIKQLDEEKP